MIDVEYEDKKAAENHLKQPIKAPDNTEYSQGLSEIPKRATNLELARWLAQGNGQVRKPITKEDLMGGTPIRIDTNYVYDGRDTDYPCDEYDYDITVRKWGDTWHEPTLDYMGIIRSVDK